MKKIAIVGAGDFGREIANVVYRINSSKENNEWELVGFFDDDPSFHSKTIDGYPVLGTIEDLNHSNEELYIICSLGVAQTRIKVINKIANNKIKYATLIDPDARIYEGASVGEGSVICGGSILAINTHLGRHVIVNLNCTLGHDDIVEDYCVVNPGVNVSGKVVIKEGCDLGTGSKIIQGLTIGENTTIGAGAVVVKDIPENCVAVGTPASPIKWK